MENRRILIDTCVIIEHLRKQNKQKSVLHKIADDYDFITSSIVEYELWAGATNIDKKRDAKNILQLFEIIPFTSDIARAAGEIYQQLKKKNKIIEIRDIFIASTAIINGLPVATFNVDHFERVEELELINPIQTL
jgi:predicted nucleic acid-binding protein